MRGFDRREFESRCARAQALMAERDLAALLLTTEPELRLAGPDKAVMAT